MSHVLHVERRRKELFGANHLRKSIFTTVMGWFLGCFGRNKERVRALQKHDNAHRRSKSSHGYLPPYKQHSPLRLGSRPSLREDSEIKHTAKLGEYCNSNITSERLPEEQFKQSYLSRVSELEEELAKLRSKLAEEAKEAQKLREEVKNFHSRGVLLQTPDELRKVCVRDSENEVSPNWHSPISKTKLYPDNETESKRAVCHVQVEKETICRKAATSEISGVSQIVIAQSKAAKPGATTIADTQNHRSDKGCEILSTRSSCKSGSVQDVMLRTWRQAQLAENKYLQQAFSQGLSVAGEESLKTPSNNSTTKEEEGVHLQAVNATVARPSGLSSAADSATYENKNQATLKPNLIKISSEKKQVTATAVNPFTENDKSAEFPGMMTIEDEKPTTQSAAKVQQLSLSTQGWGLRTFWRQPLSPVHETNSIVSSEEESGRHSARSLAVSSGLSNKVSTEALKEVQRKRPDDLDQSIGLPGNLTLPDDPCFKEMRSIMQLKSESGNQNTLSDSDELISSSVNFDTCDDSVFDTAPIQCLSPQISPVCKKGSKRNRMANSRRISVLPISLTSSPPSDAGKENVSGIQNASAFKEELVNSRKASEVQLQSTSSVLKPVENLSEWRKLKQSTSELCVDHHEQENLQSRTQFLCKNSEKSFTHLGCNESSVIGNHLVSGRPHSTMWDLTASGNSNVDLDERGQVNRRALSCMNLRSHDSYSDYAVDLSSFDFESSSTQLNEDTADTATSRIFEEFEAACVANRGDLEKVAAANEESGIVESTCMSAESAIHASPWMSRKLKPLQHASQKSPSERPILGAVAAHWVNPESAEPQWDGKGIPNSTTKYKEDQKVSWHTTPFEIRLERALATEVEVPQRNLFRWMA